MLETFQVLSVSSLGVRLSNGKGKMGRGINKVWVWGKEFCGPHAVAPQISENLVIGVDELV